MSPAHEAAIRSAVDALVAALVAATDGDTDAPDRLLSVDEAAALLGIGRSVPYSLIGSGRIRSISVGRRRLIPTSAIREFVDEAGR